MAIKSLLEKGWGDRAAVCLSSLCILHCLLLPVLLVAYPIGIVVTLSDEIFHLFMVSLALPLSLVSLYVGYGHHKRNQLIVFGGIGLVTLMFPLVAPHELISESGETWLTVSGALILCMAHIVNFRLCTAEQACEKCA
ncbi:MAG: MerC domain-containing protein [Pseudomonadota bacterium]|nr:MerC domain-containing protein [Pseudomonadota bacterium]